MYVMRLLLCMAIRNSVLKYLTHPMLHMTYRCSQMTPHALLKVGWQCKLDSL